VRFELNAYALDANIQVIAPWREWELSSRESLMDYADIGSESNHFTLISVL
jgi:argininosuccinate synthase